MKLRTKIEDYNDDDDHEAHEKLIAPPDWDGPVSQRHCTDLLCLVLLIISWIVMTIVGAYAVANGDYRVIIHPLDYDGNVCGTKFNDVDMTDYPYLYYVNTFGGGVCVKECPSLMGKVEDDLTDVGTLITYAGIWQVEDGSAELESDHIQVADYYSSSNTTEDAIECTSNDCYPSLDESFESTGIKKGFGYAYYVGDTYELLWRCYLTTDAQLRLEELTGAPSSLVGSTTSTSNSAISEYYSTTGTFFSTLYSDLWVAKDYILGFGFGVTTLISLGYLTVLRFPFLLTMVVWTSIFSMAGLFGVAGYFSYAKANEWEDGEKFSDNAITGTRYASYAFFILGGTVLIVSCCMIQQIQLAIGCVKAAGKAINSMVLILLVPVIQTIGLIAFWVVWSYYAVHLASLGDITTRDLPVGLDGTEIAIRRFEFNDELVIRCGWYLLFCLFWTAGFIVAVGDMIVAMAISKWYFAPDKSRISSITVGTSITTTVIYHLGTCAYGSLIISIIKLIRTILAKIQKKVAELSNQSIANCLLCCCQCFFCYLESCMKFINKNAYIQCAIFGTPFCQSGRKAFFLILRNAFRIAAVSYVSAAVLIIGKLFISSVTTVLAYFVMMEHVDEDRLNHVAGPLVLVYFISYVLADMFMDVFEVGIATILHCFVADEEMFSGTARYAEGELNDYITQNSER